MGEKNTKSPRINNELLRCARIAKGFSQDKLCELSGVCRSQIQRLEGGATDVKFSTISKLCNSLDLELADVFYLEDNDERNE